MAVDGPAPCVNNTASVDGGHYGTSGYIIDNYEGKYPQRKYIYSKKRQVVTKC